MKNEFLVPPIDYRPETKVDTPFLRAQQVWDERLGSAVAHARNWRLAFFGVLLISIILTTGNIYQMSRQTVTPMVVEVSKDTGKPTVIGDVTKQNYVPSEAELRYFLYEFIRAVREISLDVVVVRKRWERAYFALRPQAASYLTTLANEEASPLKNLSKILVTVDPISFTQIADSSSYQLRWRENYYSSSGEHQGTVIMTGIFEVEQSTPKTEEEVLNNPLGIYIKSFHWGKEQ